LIGLTRAEKAVGARTGRSVCPKVQYAFTDLSLTGFGGASVLADTARQG